MIYDISILQGIDGTEPAGATIVPDEGSYASQGAVKRAHQFLVALFTGSGESVADPDAGSQFPYLLFSGALKDAASLEFAFNDARALILQKMDREEPAGYPAADRISSVEFQESSVYRGSGVLRFRVVTDGGSANVMVPVKNPGVMR